MEHWPLATNKNKRENRKEIVNDWKLGSDLNHRPAPLNEVVTQYKRPLERVGNV